MYVFNQISFESIFFFNFGKCSYKNSIIELNVLLFAIFLFTARAQTALARAGRHTRQYRNE